MIAQLPEQVPPLPPPEPIIVQGIGGGPPEWIAPVAVIMLLTIVSGFFFYPLVRAWARRIEGKGADPAMADELYALRDRVAELEHQGMRVQELEERLEFAERLLLQRNDVAGLPRHEGER